jgi:hypothetical protein
MMRTILVPLGPDLASEPALDAALTLAKRMNSHIRPVFVRPDPAAALSYIPETIAASVTLPAIEREHRKIAADEKARFEAWRARHGIPAAPTDQRLDSGFAT